MRTSRQRPRRNKLCLSSASEEEFKQRLQTICSLFLTLTSLSARPDCLCFLCTVWKQENISSNLWCWHVKSCDMFSLSCWWWLCSAEKASVGWNLNSNRESVSETQWRNMVYGGRFHSLYVCYQIQSTVWTCWHQNKWNKWNKNKSLSGQSRVLWLVPLFKMDQRWEIFILEILITPWINDITSTSTFSIYVGVQKRTLLNAFKMKQMLN